MIIDAPTAVDDKTLIEHIERTVDEKLAEALSRLDTAETQSTNRATLVVFSGDMDRLMAAFIIATGAVSMGMEVSMYFTFWGLTAVKKATVYRGKMTLEKLMSVIMPKGPGGAGTSSLNMLGLGPVFFKHMMKMKNVASLEDLISLAREMGVRMIGCQMSMDVMGIRQDELLDNLDYGGVATYLCDARESRVTLFI